MHTNWHNSRTSRCRPPRGRRAISLSLFAVVAPFLIVASASGVNAAAACPESGGVAVPKATAQGEIVFTGQGSGHQTGMSQHGAQGAAALGCTYDQILQRYYTDSTVGTQATPASVQLQMLDNGISADVKAETAAVSWALIGCTGARCAIVQPLGSTWRVALNAAKTGYQLFDVTAPTTPKWSGGTATQTLRLSHSGQVVRLTTRNAVDVVLDRRLKWDYTTFSIDATKTLDVVETIVTSAAGSAMDKYLWGTAQMPASFPHEALKAQAVVARTMAMKGSASRVLGGGELAYIGYARESEGPGGTLGLLWKAAVDATSAKVLKTASGDYVDTVYALSFGGHSEDRRYVHGGATVPQLQPVDDSRWEMASTNTPDKRSWAHAFTYEQVAKAVGVDVLTSISVAPPGSLARLNGVQVVGFKGGVPVNKAMTGWAVMQALSLPSTGFTIAVNGIGGTGATPLAGDWDGDGRTDVGWFRQGRWALRNGDGTVQSLDFGGVGDVPVVGDWNGDRKDTVGVFQAGRWMLRNENTTGAAEISFAFGAPGDQPVVGDWNGNVKDGIGVFRGGGWYLRNALSGGQSRYRFQFGLPGDTAVTGDWNRNVFDGIGVYREGRWYLRNALRTGGPRYWLAYGGLSGDRPVTGDWDGNRTDTVGIVRGTEWYLRSSLYRSGRSTKLAFQG